ncbi:Hypothetical predicted protein [Podarcis lilfordi]|uniref:Uncharacterized protein n=1 Tax=Podarcis lilfordi TaxID=74358 RepID=A0AA35KLS2_9SAUR|nr:Hypothetical predicted protein [Podarcis lilfordi]
MANRSRSWIASLHGAAIKDASLLQIVCFGCSSALVMSHSDVEEGARAGGKPLIYDFAYSRGQLKPLFRH